MKGGGSIPDWFTHSLIGWITGKTTKQDIALIVIGALIPDLTKMGIVFTALGFHNYHFFDPIHTPIGAILIAGIISLFFPDIKKAFFPLGIGVITHFILDFFLIHVYGGIKLLFPFSWNEWQVYLIRSDDYWVTVTTFLISLIVYSAYWFAAQRKKRTHTLQ